MITTEIGTFQSQQQINIFKSEDTISIQQGYNISYIKNPLVVRVDNELSIDNTAIEFTSIEDCQLVFSWLLEG